MSSTKQNSKPFFYIVLTITVILAYLIAKPFLMLALIALVVAVILSPVYNFFFRITKEKESIASGLTLLVFLILLLVPLVFLGTVTVRQSITFFEDVQEVINNNDIDLDKVVTFTNETIEKLPVEVEPISEQKIFDTLEKNIQPAINLVLDRGFNIGKLIFSAIPQFIIFLIILGGLIPNQRKLREFFSNISPMDKKVDEMFINRFLAMAQSMLKGSLVIGIAQGVLSGVILHVAGVPYTFFWIVIITFVSIIPLGAGIINPPIGIVLLLLGHYWQGALVLLFHFIVITNVDNLLRPMLVSEDAKLHPALTLVGALGGITLFGFWGVIFGPVVMILLVTMLEVYMTYYRNIPVLKEEPVSDKSTGKE